MKRTPLKPGRPLQRKTPLAQMGRKALRERDALKAFREALAFRSGGMCELRTPACPAGEHRGHHAHHQAPSDRDRGVHLPSRGLWACADGHRYLHANPAESYERGWLLRDGAA